MAVKCSHQPVHVSQDEFHQIDYQVMQQAFMLQNKIGNLRDEHKYQTRLASACAASGLEVFRKACISVSHDGFLKNYFMDLLICGNIYELKTVSATAAQHHSQTLNYVLLSNVRHAKIINFRQDSVKWKYVSTTLSSSFCLKIILPLL
jgi:GxxExxY protein